MTKKTESQSIAKAQKIGSVAGTVLGMALSTTVWIVTALCAVSLGVWPFVAWFWAVVFWLRGVSKTFIRYRYEQLSGESGSYLTWREQSKEIARIREERKRASV